MLRAGALVALCLLTACGAVVPTGIAAIPSRENPRCLITEVVDGDTVKISCRGGEPRSARLVGFDTPETFRPGCNAEKQLGETASYYLKRRLEMARVIGMDVQGTDRYDRALVRLRLDGEDLARIMVSQGLAVRYSGGKRIDWCARLAA